MPGPVFLTGDRLTLRAVTDEDHEFLAVHWNDPSVRRMTNRHGPQTETDVSAFLDGDRHGAVVPFLACRDGDPVGFAWAFGIDDVAGHGAIGYWIIDDERDQGYGTETVSLLVEWAFEDRQLHKVGARVFDGNHGSRRVLETVGFQHEGTLREHYRVEGEFVDAQAYGLLADEW